MTGWREGIKEPDTLKATLEFLSAIRANILLRNTICDVFSDYGNGYCSHEASNRNPFHTLLENIVDLRARLLGHDKSGQYGSYGDYQAIVDFIGDSKECDNLTRECIINVRRKGSTTAVCLANLDACAKKLAGVILKVLPNLYNTLNSVLARLWDDGKWLFKRCNDENGSLYKLLTSDGDIHDKEECPYSKMGKLKLGFTKGDIHSQVLGEKVQDTINSLVGNSGSLWSLIVLIKGNNIVSASSSLYASIGNKNQFNTRCLCIERTVEANETSHNIYGSNRQARSSVRSAGGNAPTRRRRARRSAPPASVPVTPKTIDNPDVSTAPKSHGPVTAPSVTVGTHTLSASTTKPRNTYATPSRKQADVPLPGEGYPNNGIMYFHSPSSSSQSRFGGDNWQETRVEPQSNPNSNCAASGVAAGCVLVGCVGVGAAYGFNIGGFGTMVNSMF
ncbi:RNA 2',3'-cyclic phosphodiesterase [Babesia caballi]|uniref:RNA 2',3'-cyclic phosphodiesterase n=1 Tax=Babesia caballi TaxID=5871 RepID=A0AAV4M0P7_BABCB|nr:RNA 2',3'-cyclic phosphodiesterase [Babesia caballi]